jgi:flavin-binding protein dodecin
MWAPGPGDPQVATPLPSVSFSLPHYLTKVAGQRWDAGGKMTNHVYKTIELVGSSATSVEDAIRNAVAKASQTVRNLRWFEVTETRGHSRAARWRTGR